MQPPCPSTFYEAAGSPKKVTFGILDQGSPNVSKGPHQISVSVEGQKKM